MGKVRLKVREFADLKGWTLREISDRSAIPYATIKKYAKAPTLATVDYTALIKLARVFEVEVSDLIEVIEE
jgi:putative transcriptional regulator